MVSLSSTYMYRMCVHMYLSIRFCYFMSIEKYNMCLSVSHNPAFQRSRCGDIRVYTKCIDASLSTPRYPTDTHVCLFSDCIAYDVICQSHLRTIPKCSFSSINIINTHIQMHGFVREWMCVCVYIGTCSKNMQQQINYTYTCANLKMHIWNIKNHRFTKYLRSFHVISMDVYANENVCMPLHFSLCC